jgi:choline dehydrogenase-like flavoprotein
VLTTTDLAFSVLAGQTAGGSSTINWMTCLKPPPWAREEWERESGMTGVASPAFDSFIDEVWSRLHVNIEESVVNPSNDVLRRGSEALGYRLGVDYDVIPRNAHGCAGRCDFCFFGCVYDAKQSSLVTYLPDAHRAGARFLFDTKADHVIVQDGEVGGVEATLRDNGDSIPVHVRARTVVAAGSAIQTPALLLRSGIRSPGVGFGLRLDPTTALFGEFPAPIRMWSGPMQTIVVRRFQGSDEGHHGPWLESAPGHPGLSALAIPWSGGRAHKDAMRRLERAASTIVLVRDVAEGRVTIDARGEPLLEYRLSTRDRRNLTRGLQEAARIQRAAGALRMGSLHLRECSVGDGSGPIRDAEFDAFIDRLGRLGIRENGVALFSAHPMGSARAGTNPKTSAAKPTGESHDVRNLWIGDGSLLPTAPGVNPMISIMALAARTAGFIRERLAHVD